MAVCRVFELEEVGSVELSYLSSDLVRFLYGTPEEQSDRAPVVCSLLHDQRLKNISGYLDSADGFEKNPRYFLQQASQAFDEIERILTERAGEA
jgi:hypothetical protein